MKNNLINLCDSQGNAQLVNPAHVVRIFLHGGTTSDGFLVNVELSSGSVVTLNFTGRADHRILVEVASWFEMEVVA
jgi:hypothetical protein